MAGFAMVAAGTRVHILTEDGKGVLCGCEKDRKGYGYVAPRPFPEGWAFHPSRLCKSCVKNSEGK